MAKPILVLHYCIEGLPEEAIIKNMRRIIDMSRNAVDDEYFVFVLATTKDSYVEVFYDKDFNETSYKELSERLMNEIEQLKTNKQEK